MPRIPREKNYFEFFHVMIQGINKEYIFKNELEINTYLKYLKEKIKDKNLQIISYCIMNNHAHFLIHTDEVYEISKLMSQVNTKYAMFYNKLNDRCGVVFRNRFKSEQILSYSHLISCINYIHDNPVKANMCNKKEEYKYSSYKDYTNNGKMLNMYKIFDVLKEYNITKEEVLKENFKFYKFIDDIEYEDKNKIKEQILNEFFIMNKINDKEEIRDNKQYLKQISTIMYVEYNFKQKEIAEFLGVSKLKINRILNEI